MDTTQSETEKIRMALQVLYGGELDEVQKKLTGLPLDLAHYKTYAIETEKFLNALDRVERARLEAFLESEQAYNAIKERYAPLNTMGVYTPLFESIDGLLAGFKLQMADTLRWKIIARAAMNRYYEQLAKHYEDVGWSAAEKEELKRDMIRQIDYVKQIATEKGVDLDLEAAFRQIEEKKERVEAQTEVIKAEMEGGIEKKSEVEVVQAVLRYHTREGAWPNYSQLWKEIRGKSYDRMNAIKRLLRAGRLVEVKGKGLIRYLTIGDAPLKEKTLDETYKVQLKRVLAEKEGENEGKSA